MNDHSRRKTLKTLLTGGIGLLSGVDPTSAQTQPAATPVARAFQGRHQPKPLPFDPAKLAGISEKLIRSHWENNYGGAVAALNTIEQKLAVMLGDSATPGYIYGDLKREELARTGSVVLHELYFANLGGDGKVRDGALDLIKRFWGKYETWEMEFQKTAQALAGGSGWVVLAYNFHTGEAHNYWASDHLHNAPMSYPLLVLDMYEHAYHMDYGSAAAKYVAAFLQNIKWEEVSRRVEAVHKSGL